MGPHRIQTARRSSAGGLTRFHRGIPGLQSGEEVKNGDRFQGGAGLSHAEYDAQKWSTRSDGIARPPITMRTREYHPLGRPLRSVWAVNPQPFTDGQHLATFAEALVVPMVLAGTSERGCCPPVRHGRRHQAPRP
jgi:hypothetical protein